ncbi:MAG TPA: tripartite tricarboxylate transporter substrate binding protein [Burkholderiales bacterium]|nr:tripartite tricarboxylate transporter substrate binding protein [Burkholderiales bacterium]
MANMLAFCRNGFVAVTLCSIPALAAAQTAYPVKPVRMIAPFPPGGTSDVLARIVAQKLSDTLGRQVIVENRPGAGANIGHEFAAKQPPDGYTLLLSSNAALVANPHLYKRLGFDPLNDFTPVSLVAKAGPVLVVHPSVPARSVKELIALAKARPGKLNFGSGGRGTPAHVVGEIFKSVTGINIVHVPYKGGVLAVMDLVAGQIDLVFADMAPAVPHIKAGKLRALAVTSDERSAALPDVPTMVEAGIWRSSPQTWWAVIAPKGVPGAIVARLNSDLAQILKQPDVQERYATLGISPVHSSPEQVLEMVKSELPVLGKALKAAGVEPE